MKILEVSKMYEYDLQTNSFISTFTYKNPVGTINKMSPMEWTKNNTKKNLEVNISKWSLFYVWHCRGFTRSSFGSLKNKKRDL